MSNVTNTAGRTEADTVAELAAQAAETEIQAPGEIVAVADGPGRVRIEDLEQYAEHPRRAKAARTVYDAASFAAYLHRHEGPATEVYADVQAAKVVGIIDSHEGRDLANGDPGWQAHRITLQLTQSPSWIAWTGNDGKFLPQDEFAEFAEMRAADVREPSPADLLELAQRLTMTKGVEYESGKRLQDGQTQLVYKETVSARAGQRGDLEIPQYLRLAIKPHIGGPTYGVTARFRYRLRGTALVLGYVLERPDLILESAFGDVVEALSVGIDDDIEKGITGYSSIAAPIFQGKP
jgi:uncharacterized protein YfdQ (DUF2303 family)